ncbi:MAG: hypothetical protein ACO20M_06380 [Methylophilaceae bacterium]
MARFKVYGDYGYITEKLMAEYDSYQDAIAVLEKPENRGPNRVHGHTTLEVGEFLEDGEFRTHRIYHYPT